MLTEAPPNRSFARRLAMITGGGAAIRALAAGWYDAHTRVSGDAAWYVATARFVADGVGFVEPVNFTAAHVRVETAAHPPAYSVYLSVMDLAGWHSPLAHRWWSMLPAVGAVVLLGLVTRTLAGDRAGLIAAAAAAGFLSLIVQSVDLWSEGMYVFTVAVVLWCCLRVTRRPSAAQVAALGAAIGLATLTRAEAILFVLVLALLVFRSGRPAGERLRWVGVGLMCTALVLAPWFVYNASRFDDPVALTTAVGPLLWSSNCDSTYSGPNLGGWGFICAKGHQRFSSDESVMDGEMRRAGIRYMTDHAERLPVVIPVRLLRTFGFWHAAGLNRETLLYSEADLGWLGMVSAVQYWIFLAIGIFGVRTMARRRLPLLPVLAPAALAAVTSVVAYGSVRFRIGIDAVLPILVGIGASAFLDHRSARANQVAAPSGIVSA